MQILKKSFTITLFICLIALFVIDRSGFQLKSEVGVDKLNITLNSITPKFQDSTKRLSIEYETFIIIDTLNLEVTKAVYKTFSLKVRPHMISSSKSMPLYEIYENYAIRKGPATKNPELIEKLTELRIIHVDVSSNGAFDMLRRDADLVEAIELVEENKLTIDYDIKYALRLQDDIDYFWDIINNVVYVSFGDEELFMVKRDLGNEFLQWYSLFDSRRNIKEIMASSSKSLVVISDDKIKSSLNLMEDDRKLLKLKIDEILRLD